MYLKEIGLGSRNKHTLKSLAQTSFENKIIWCVTSGRGLKRFPNCNFGKNFIRFLLSILGSAEDFHENVYKVSQPPSCLDRLLVRDKKNTVHKNEYI